MTTDANNNNRPSRNRVLVVDDDAKLIKEYLECLGDEFEAGAASTTLGDLEKVLFGEDGAERGKLQFSVDSRNQGDLAVRAVEEAVDAGNPYSIVFLDIKMPPGIDGIEAAGRIRELDPNVNIVIVTGSLGAEPEDIGALVPPADKIFFFKKPFHAIECRQLAAALCGKWHADLALRVANERLEQRVRERTAALHQLAYHDSVTDLPNRLSLIEELRGLTQKAASGEENIAVILLDIERFSFLNETMGYEAGTELLQAIGNRLNGLLDASATRLRPVVGRFGADEFACLVPYVQQGNALQALVEYVRDAMEQPFLIDGRDVYLKSSIGVSWFPEHDREAQTLFRYAEAALHRSMRKANKRITYYNPEMHYRARHRFQMESELRSAIDNGQIGAWYQPQVCLKTGKLAGVEALARWRRLDGSIVYPADFIPLSEEMGISDLLFEAMLGDVCTAVRRWRNQGGWSVPVSVNLSAQQLRNKHLVEEIRRILENHLVEESLINLELTETVLLDDLTIAQPVLRDLADYGVGIHIDDFGTGYSSLSYLAELPVQTLKIDQSFVERLTESETNERVVQAVIALGKAMGLDVVAEGVESAQQFETVRAFGCDLAQGYYISRPLPAKEFREWCEEQPQLVAEPVRDEDLSGVLPHPG